MIIEPISLAAPAIQIHAIAALLAIVLGTIVLFLKKGTRLHKAMGRTWIGLMALAALSSFAIHEGQQFGPFSWIHGLSVLTLVMIVRGVWFARQGNIKAHRSTMISLYIFALIITGAFTLLPGRRMHAVLFADGGQSAALLGAGVALTLALALAARYWRDQRARTGPRISLQERVEQKL